MKRSFLKFPNDLEMKGKWISAIGRLNWNPNSRSVVCERHFIDGDFYEDNRIIEDESINLLANFHRRILLSAVPSINLSPQKGKVGHQ